MNIKSRHPYLFSGFWLPNASAPIKNITTSFAKQVQLIEEAASSDLIQKNVERAGHPLWETKIN